MAIARYSERTGNKIKHIQNFGISGTVEGKTTKVTGYGKGFNLDIAIKNDGEIKDALTITGFRDIGDKLIIRVVNNFTGQTWRMEGI